MIDGSARLAVYGEHTISTGDGAAFVHREAIGIDAAGAARFELPVTATDRAGLLLRVLVAPGPNPIGIVVLVNDRLIAAEAFVGRHYVTCRLPADLLAAGDRLSVIVAGRDATREENEAAFTIVDAALIRASQFRAVSPPVMALPGNGPAPSLHDVMMSLENLGDNCELGCLQRRLGCEPLGLLRFSRTPVDSLVAMLDTRFAGLLDAAELEIFTIGLPDGLAAYKVRHTGYGFDYHTLVLTTQMTADAVLRRERTRLVFARRKLLEHLENGDRIFVHKHRPALTDAELAGLHAALRCYGPATLLCVEEADAAHPPGSVEILTDGLVRGRTSRFAPYTNADLADDASWISVCRATHELWQGSRVILPHH